MKGKRKLILAGALVLILTVAGMGGAIAFAQGPTGTPPTQSGRGAWQQLYLQALAQKLGTTVEKLQTAMTDAQKDALAQAVKQGLMTQAQADRVSGNTAHAAIAQAGMDAAAKTLGMTTADLTTALKTKTLLDLANEKKADVTKLRTAMVDAEKAAIDQAIKDGKLTQAQADALKANLKPENIDLNRHGFGLGMPGGKDGFPGGNRPGANQPGGFAPPGAPGGRLPGRPGGR